jgi:uncharacterized cupredoxin-like copper-binding protein
MIALVLVLAACGSDDGAGTRDASTACEPVGDPDAAGSTVTVTLREYVIETDGDASAGSVALEATNDGTIEHEVVVVRAGSPDALPTGDDGGLDEDALPDGALIGEIEPFAAGEACAGAFHLEAGSYVLLCNVPGHFAAGMATAIDVT